jgi:hypothetical protein
VYTPSIPAPFSFLIPPQNRPFSPKDLGVSRIVAADGVSNKPGEISHMFLSGSDLIDELKKSFPRIPERIVL